MSIPDLIIAEAGAQGVPAELALEVAHAESGFNQDARGSSGEVGVFQLMEDTAADLGVDRYDLQQNIHGGVKYLAQQLARFGDPVQAVAAYNAGPGAVGSAIAKYGTDGFVSAEPGAPFIPAWLASLTATTRNYVAGIFGNLNTEYTATPSNPGVSPASSPFPPFLPGEGIPGQPAEDYTVFLVFAAVGLVALVLYANSAD